MPPPIPVIILRSGRRGLLHVLHYIKAQTLEKRGDHAAALGEAAIALDVFSAKPGLMYRAAAVRESMAGILLAMGSLTQALAQVQQARKTFDTAYGPGVHSYYLGKAWLTEAKIDRAAGDIPGTRAAAQAAYVHLAASVGETHPLTAEATSLAHSLH